MESFDKLINATYASVPDYTDIPPDEKLCKVLKVYDGDTLWLATYFSNEVKRVKVRLARIDTAEIRGVKKCKLTNSIEEEKAIAQRAKDFNINKILDKIVLVSFGKHGTKGESKDKYGRHIVELYYDDSAPGIILGGGGSYNTNLSDALLANGLAIVYK